MQTLVLKYIRLKVIENHRTLGNACNTIQTPTKGASLFAQIQNSWANRSRAFCLMVPGHGAWSSQARTWVTGWALLRICGVGCRRGLAVEVGT